MVMVSHPICMCDLRSFACTNFMRGSREGNFPGNSNFLNLHIKVIKKRPWNVPMIYT